MLETELREMLRRRAGGAPPLPDPTGPVRRRAAAVRRRRRRLVVAGSAAAVLLILLGGLTAVRLARGDRPQRPTPAASALPTTPPSTRPADLDLLVDRTIRPAGGGAPVPLPAGLGAQAGGGGKVPGGWLITSRPAVGQDGPQMIGLVDPAGRLVWNLPGQFLTVAPGGRTAVWLTGTGTQEVVEAHDTATGATTGTLAVPANSYAAGFWRDEVLVARTNGADPTSHTLTLWDPATGRTSGAWSQGLNARATGTSPDGRYLVVVRTTVDTARRTVRTCLVELDPAAALATHATFCLPATLSNGVTSTESPDRRWLIWIVGTLAYRFDLRTLFDGKPHRPVPACSGDTTGALTSPVWENAQYYLLVRTGSTTMDPASVLRCRVGSPDAARVQDPRVPLTPGLDVTALPEA